MATKYSAYSNVASDTTMTVGEALIRASNTLCWFVSSETSTITQDVNNHVSRWNDLLGSGRDLKTKAGTPHWSVDGVLFDGATDYMKCDAFTLNQPQQMYLVMKQITWTLNDRFFDGNISGQVMSRQTTASPGISINAGSASGTKNDLVLNTWGIVRILFNGANSKLQINVAAAWTGNAGANNAAGFTLGGGATGGNCSNIQVKEVIVRNVADGANETPIYDYLKAKYGL